MKTIFPDSKNRIWIGTKNLANVIEHDSVFRVQFEKRYSNDQTRAFGEKADGTVYLGAFNYLFKIVQSSRSTYQALRIPEIRGAYSGIAVINSPPLSNDLWLGTYGEGVVNLAKGKRYELDKRWTSIGYDREYFAARRTLVFPAIMGDFISEWNVEELF